MPRRSPSVGRKSPSPRSPSSRPRLPGAPILLLLPCLALATTACSSLRLGGSSHKSDVELKVESLELELQRQAAIDKIEIDRLRQRLAELEERVAREAEERAAAAARANGPRGIEEEKVPVPRRTVEVIEVSDIEEPLEEPLEEPPVAEPPVAEAAPPAAPPTAAASPIAAPAVPPAVETEITPVAQALYDQGYSLYHQGRYVDAEETFQRFLAAYGATDLGDNAQFWIGACRLGRNELQSALAALRQAVRERPEGNKAPDALLAAGGVLERLNDADGARTTYLEVERRFPESPASTEAAKRRQRLGGA